MKTVATLLPEAERTERGLVFDVPDVTSMSVHQTNEWLTGLHPGRELILPEDEAVASINVSALGMQGESNKSLDGVKPYQTRGVAAVARAYTCV